MARMKKQIERQHNSKKRKRKNLAKREAYENSVAEKKININQKIVMFLYSRIAGIHGMQKADFYETDDKKREFQVNFD